MSDRRLPHRCHVRANARVSAIPALLRDRGASNRDPAQPGRVRLLRGGEIAPRGEELAELDQRCRAREDDADGDVVQRDGIDEAPDCRPGGVATGRGLVPAESRFSVESVSGRRWSGFGGAEDEAGELEITPRLPPSWQRLAFSLRFRERQLRVDLGHDEERHTIDDGHPLEVVIRGKRRRLEPGTPLTLQPAQAS